jgi:hypothetical protein
MLYKYKMTSEYNFGTNPLYNDLGTPYQNMAKNEYTTLDNYSYFRSPNRSILSTFLKAPNKSVAGSAPLYAYNSKEMGGTDKIKGYKVNPDFLPKPNIKSVNK